MGYNFPDTPAPGEVFAPPSGPTWRYVDGVWQMAGDTGGAPLAGAVWFETVLAATGADIDVGVGAFQTAGYGAPGDGGGALYKRVGSMPTHIGRIQSADGAWWELAETVIDLRMLGGGTGNPAGDTAAFQGAIDMLDGGTDRGTIRLPPGNVSINATLNILSGKFDIVGCGIGASRLTSAVIGAPTFKSGDDVSFMHISDFTCLGNNLTGASGNGHCFAFWDTTGPSTTPQAVVFERLSIEKFRGNDTEGSVGDSDNAMKACAFNIKRALGCVIRDVVIAYCGGGIYSGKTQNCLIDNPTISWCDAFGILDYSSAALRITGGDVQMACLDGTAITVAALPIPCANIVSYLGGGTVVSGTKTKNATANAQIYVEQGFGVVLEKLWVQTSMSANVPHKGILAHACSSVSVVNCEVSMTPTDDLWIAQKHTGIEFTNHQNVPMSGQIRGNHIQFPASRPVRAAIAVTGVGSGRYFNGVTVEQNTVGNRAAPGGTGTVVDDGILVQNVTLRDCRIANNVLHAITGVTFTRGIGFFTTVNSGGNYIRDNSFLVAGGAITTTYTALPSEATATVDPASLALAASSAPATIAVSGAVLGDFVRASFTNSQAGVSLHAYVSAADTVSYYFRNDAGANPTDLASGTLKVRVEK